MHNHKGKKAVFGGFAKSSLALLALIVLVLIISTPSAQARVPELSSPAAVDDGQPLVFEEAQAVEVGSGIVSEPKGATGSEIYLVRLSEPPVAAYRGGIAGFEATNPSVRGLDKLEMDSVEAVAYSSYLEARQADVISRVNEELQRELDVVYQYQTANNGFAAYMTPEEAQIVSRLPGVIFVQRNQERELHTDNGPSWIGAPAIWGGHPLSLPFETDLEDVDPLNTWTGYGSFSLNPATGLFTWNITHDVSVSGSQQRRAYIRAEQSGADPVIASFEGNSASASPIVGSTTLTGEQQGWLMDGDFYVEIERRSLPFPWITRLEGYVMPVAAAEGNMGEGIIVGVIDTGINPSNPSFADIGDDGYDHENPWGAYVGVCDPASPDYDATFPCNDKLIGAWGYSTVNGGDPRDYDSHGSHTASTAAGNFVFDAEVVGPTISIERAISGVAPHANIVAYAACCTLDALTAAIDQAVADGVDVINYSIGSDAASDVWNDFDTVGYLNAREAGIFVATSAGNAGPGDETLGSPADAPWLLSVGATTHDRALVNSLVNMSGGATTPPADIVGRSFSAGVGPAEIVYAGDYPSTETATPELCGAGASETYNSPWPAGTFTGKIVICDRGNYARVEKGFNVLEAGAVGMILANDAASGDSLNGDAHYLPTTHITYDDGVILKAWVADGGTGHTGTITATTPDESPAYADIMAAFSSRGANRALADIIVPSVSAPGVDIMAAVGIGDPDPAQWGFISGTSMASPHAAGAAALLIATHPEWSPAEIQSVLMTTSWTDVLDDDATTPATPFDMGSGRIDLSTAANAGLVLDESIANYENANPAIGGDPKTLNLASFGNGQCVLNCSWTRTVESTSALTVTWTASVTSAFTMTVEPASFELAPGASQVITVTADVEGEATDIWHFGEVQLAPDDAALSTAHFPVAVRPTTGTLPGLVEIQTRRDAGSQLVEGFEAIEITDLTVDAIGLAEAVIHEDALDEISDPGASFPEIFFDHLGEAMVAWTAVPADAYGLVVEVADTTSLDLDMLVGFDANDNGIPELGEEECQSAAGGPFEYCDIPSPDEGDWWAIVINFAASATPPDPVTLAAGVIPNADSGNMWAEGPVSVPLLEPFDIRVFWNIPGMEAGDRYYGALSLGTDPANPGNIGDIRVNLARLEDDVAKTAELATGVPGDTIEYTITVQPNSLTEDVTYWLTDTIPAGLTYVPGSAVASAGTVDVTGDTLTWSGDVPAFTRGYVMSTSNEDASCIMPLANSGAYVDLLPLGPAAQPTIFGHTLWYTAFTLGAPINYWGTDHVGINFTDDGMVFFSSTPGATPWVNESIPTGADPNNLLAMFWSDFEVIYDGPSNRGVSLASLGGTGAGGAVLIEYDDVALYNETEAVMDFEVLVWRTPLDGPGNPEIIFAYDNIASIPEYGTIGIENADGTEGIEYAFDDARLETISDGMAICFDWALLPADPVTITYAATVDAWADGTLTNNVESITSNPGSMLEATSADVEIDGVGVVYGVDLSGDQAASGLVGTDVSYSMVVTNTGTVADSFALTVDSGWAAEVVPTNTGSLEPGASATLEVTVTVPDAAEAGDTDVAAVTATSAGDNAVSDMAELTTTATVDVTYGVELSATPAALSGYVGTTVLYTVNITNLGSDADTFTLVASGNGWTTTITPDEITLLANESAELTVAVVIPANAAAGDTDYVSITAISDGDAEASDTVTLTTTADYYKLFMPLLQKND